MEAFQKGHFQNTKIVYQFITHLRLSLSETLIYQSHHVSHLNITIHRLTICDGQIIENTIHNQKAQTV